MQSSESIAASPRSVSEPADGLTILAVAYLAIPNLIFIVGWFRPVFAGGLLLAMAIAFRSSVISGKTRLQWPLSPSVSACLLLAAAAWSFFGGGSHFVNASHDWVVRDAVLGDLIYGEWPVSYKGVDGSIVVLRSAIGYFLPPALFARTFGFQHIDLAVFTWTTTGVWIFLSLLPLPRHATLRLPATILVTVFFSGMDYLGVLLATQMTPIFPLRLEWWVPMSYPSLTGQLLWAPNHCLPIWIATLLVLRHRDVKWFPQLSLVLIPLTLIWTPFAAIGLLPFLVLAAWRPLAATPWRDWPWLSASCAALFSLAVVAFLTIDVGGMVIAANLPPATEGLPSDIARQGITVRSYLIFVVCEFLLLSIAIAVHVRRDKDFFLLSLLVLFLLPLLNYGPSNDAMLRLCVPPLIVLFVTCLRVLLPAEARRPTPTQVAAWVCLLVGAATAFNELWRSATFHRWPANYDLSLAEQQGGHLPFHYAGRFDSSWLKSLMKDTATPRFTAASPSHSPSQVKPERR